MSWDDTKTDGVSTEPAAEYNDLVNAVKHMQAQSAKWSTMNAATTYIFQIAGSNKLTMSTATTVTTLQAGNATGDGLTLQGYDTYPKVVLTGNTKLDLYAVTNINLYSSATNYGQFTLSGSDFQMKAMGANYNIAFIPNGTGQITFSTAKLDVGPDFAYKYPAAATITGNPNVIIDIDGKTNITTSGNAGVTGLKIHTAAKIGTGVSCAIDTSDMTSMDYTLKAIASGTTPTVTWNTSPATFHVSGAPAGYLKINIGGTPYYVPYWA